MRCDEAQAALAALQERIVALEELLAEPGDLDVHQRSQVLAQLHAAQGRLPAARAAVAGCLDSPLRILGVERTQGTQFFNWNGQGSGAAPDNSVPLIAHRGLTLRAYVGDTATHALPAQVALPTLVGGRVRYRRIDPAPSGYVELGPLSGAVAARAPDAVNRGDWNQTLNFGIDGWECYGTVEFTVEIFEQPPLVQGALLAAAPTSVADSQTFTVRFESVPAFRLVVVPIHYVGPDRAGSGTLDIAAPDAFDVALTLDFIVGTYPIARLDILACDAIDYDQWLHPGAGGGCGLGWDRLLAALDDIRAGGDHSAMYLGQVPIGVPGYGVLGCGGGGLAAGYEHDGGVCAQEVGHGLGRAHAPCGNPGGVDPDFPVYGAYPAASIGEYGVDPGHRTVHDPNTTFDFMSYCAPRWISPYTYMALRNAMVHQWGTSARSATDPDRELLRLHLLVCGDEVALRPAFHRPGRAPAPGGPETQIICELADADGRLLVAHRCSLPDHRQDPDADCLTLRESVPWFDEAARLTIRRGREIVHSVEIEPEAPTVEVAAVAVNGHTAAVNWHGRHARSALTYVVDYSNDDGATWKTVAPSRTEAKASFDLRRLPGGERCRFRVLATAGFRTGAALSEPFAVATKPRTATIATPADGAPLQSGAPLALAGGGLSPDHGLSDPADAVWTSSLDGIVGRGHRLLGAPLSDGPHTLTLSVPDGECGVARASVDVVVRRADAAPVQDDHDCGCP